MIKSDQHLASVQGRQGAGEAVAGQTADAQATGSSRHTLTSAMWERGPALTHLILQRNLDF